MIKPFEHIKKPTAAKGIASVKYVERRLREVLGKLHFTGAGVKSSADGQIHIEVPTNNEVGDYPFKVSTFVAQSNGRTGVTVAPGLVYSNTLPSGWMHPVMAGKSLLADPPPALAPNGNLSHICLIVEIGTDGKAINTPWEIKAFDGAAPTNTALRRINSASGSPQQGKYHVLIASIYAAEVYQWTRGNISFDMQWEVPSVRA